MASTVPRDPHWEASAEQGQLAWFPHVMLSEGTSAVSSFSTTNDGASTSIEAQVVAAAVAGGAASKRFKFDTELQAVCS